MKLIRIVLACTLLTSACLRQNSDDKRSKNRDQAASPCAPALEAYNQLIEPIVEQRCINCHVSGGSGAIAAAFQSGNAVWNMAVFSKLKNGDADAIFKKASNQESHGGGRQLQDNELEKLKSFFAASAQCSGPLAGGTEVALCDGKALPRRVTLLSRAELRNTVQAIAGVNVDVNVPAAAALEDGNKNPRLAFSNDQKSRTIDSNLAFQIKQAAALIAKDFAPAKKEALGCSTEPVSDVCLQNLGAKVYRRPLTAEENSELKALGSFANIVTYLFQSPDFLYRTELGSETSPQMTSYEIASALSYLLTAMPPDAELMQLAEQGALQSAATRRAQAERLLKGTNGLSEPLQNFLVEWLELGPSEMASKDGAYDGKAVFAEARSFLNKVIQEDGSLETLLTREDGGRLGILQQKAFLASHSNNNSTSPVKIGKTVARNMLCLALPPPPANVNNNLAETPELKTTRSKLAQHTANPVCASCHARIDPFGLAFENFDQFGMSRTVENGEPVDTRVSIALGLSIDKAYDDSTGLIQSMSQSRELAACFDSFFQQYAYGTLSCEAQSSFTPGTSLREYILNLVSSDRFITRIP
jgi:mono/diheme cytochrome c family protein